MSREPCQLRERPASGARRTRQAWWLACTATWAACQPAAAPTFATATALPDRERHPDAIAVDLPPTEPPARTQGSTEQAVTTLRTPLGIDAAYAAVHAFFQAVIHEDMAALSALMQPGTQAQDLQGSLPATVATRTQSQEARSWWTQRFRKHEYAELASKLIYRDRDIETYRATDLGALPAEVRPSADVPGPAVTELDVVLRVPIVTHSLRSERLLGDELYVWLRPEGDRFLIYHLAEPFSP
jgi:hypothetical protein